MKGTALTFSTITTAAATGKRSFNILIGNVLAGICRTVSNSKGRVQWRVSLVDTSRRSDGRRYDDRVIYYQDSSAHNAKRFVQQYAAAHKQHSWMLNTSATRKACRATRLAMPECHITRWHR